MAIKRLTISGNGQIELNRCAFQKDGRIEAQCAWDENSAAENGMLLAVNKVTGKVNLPGATETKPILLNFTAEKNYEVGKTARKNFSAKKGDMLRLGYLQKGDLFTNNVVSYDTTTFTNDEEFLAGIGTSAVVGTVASDGSIFCAASVTANGIEFDIIKATKLADNSIGIQFQVK